MAHRAGRKPKIEATPTPANRSPAPSIPAAEALSFLRDTRGLSTWTTREAAKLLNISVADAKRVIAILELQGYAKPTGREEWMTTVAGEEVSGSKTPRFTRERVEQVLADLRSRIAQTNADRDAPYSITKAVAFGDFLGNGSRVQAVQAGIELKRKGSDANDADSAIEKNRHSAVLKRLRGKGGAVQVAPYENWMSERTHLDLLR